MVGRPARRPDRTTAVNSGRRRRRACAGNTSGGEVLATLAPTAGEDRPARAGTHPQPEAVGLRPTAVVRLERALAHEVLLRHDIDGAHPVGGRGRGVPVRRPRAAPRRPRKLVTADRHTWAPSTDSDQHNRDDGTTGGRPHRRPLMVPRAASGEGADAPWWARPAGGADAPGAPPRALPGCGRGC